MKKEIAVYKQTASILRERLEIDTCNAAIAFDEALAVASRAHHIACVSARTMYDATLVQARRDYDEAYLANTAEFIETALDLTLIKT